VGEKLTEYLIGSLLFAWFLSLFDFNVLFISGFKELFGLTITNGTYYLIFFLFGVIFGYLEVRKH
jgi:hypothetical protein